MTAQSLSVWETRSRLRLTAQEVFVGYAAIIALLNSGRPLPLAAAGRLLCMADDLKPSFTDINDRRNAIIKSYDKPALDSEDRPISDQYEIPPDKAGDFAAQWAAFGPVDVGTTPIGISQFLMVVNGSAHLAITLQELTALGPLVTE